MSDEPVWLTRQEAAERARVSVDTLDRAVRRGELQAGGGRGFVRIKPEWVDEWIESRAGLLTGCSDGQP